jgi:hypothetical protein
LSGFLRFLLSSPRISCFMIARKWGGVAYHELCSSQLADQYIYFNCSQK